MELKIRKIDPDLPAGIALPAYIGDAGLDLVAVKDMTLYPNSFGKISHNVAVEIPPGWFGYILPRSSTITAHSGLVQVMASPIDSGYRGAIFTMLRNNSPKEIKIVAGFRLAQLVILPFLAVSGFQEVEQLSDSHRSSNGFGSSGK